MAVPLDKWGHPFPSSRRPRGLLHSCNNPDCPRCTARAEQEEAAMEAAMYEQSTDWRRDRA